MSRIVFSILTISFAFCVFAGHVKKGFKQLAASNYSYALHHFSKGLKKDKAAAAFGLTKFYLAPGMYNIDSSFRYILICEQSFARLNSKSRLKLIKYQCDSLQINTAKTALSRMIYNRLTKSPTLESVKEFLIIHPWSELIPAAIDLRDSLAFSTAVLSNTAQSFADFIEAYPESKLFSMANDSLNALQYKENTGSGSMEDLERFLEYYPTNSFVSVVEDELFQRFSAKNSLDEWVYFVRHFPKNRNVNEAWRKVFQLFMKDYSNLRLEDFKLAFHDYPFLGEIDNEIERFEASYYPIQQEEKFGFMDESGAPVISAEYEHVNSFNEGLAVVISSSKHGAIDKRNKVVVDFSFDNMEDFHLGKSIVERNHVFGLIDRNGVFAFPLEYDELGWLNDSLLYAKKNGLFGIYNTENKCQSDLFFDDIIPFDGRLARVSVNNKVGYLNRALEMEIPAEFDELIVFTDSSFVYSLADKKGLLDAKNRWRTLASYDEIYPINDGLAMVRVMDKIGYIDAIGNLILAVQFEQFPNFSKVGMFREKTVVVKKKGKFLLINNLGEVLMSLPYDGVGEWGAWFPVMKNVKWGFINPKGKEVTLFDYDFVEKVNNNLFIVEKNGSFGLLSVNGIAILPPEFKSIFVFGDSLLLVQDANGYGISTLSGEVLIQRIYDEIKSYENDVLELHKNQVVSYYQLKIGKLIEPK